jgi:hypothetical protein
VDSVPSRPRYEDFQVAEVESMSEGRIVLGLPGGERIDYRIVEARLTPVRTGDTWWLGLMASARPDDWTPDSGEREPPTVEVAVRVAEPDPATWAGLRFVVPEERDEQTGCYPAWLYYDEGYEVLGGCVLSVGEQTRSTVHVRLVGQGTDSGSTVEVTGIIPLAEDHEAMRA